MLNQRWPLLVPGVQGIMDTSGRMRSWLEAIQVPLADIIE